MTSGELLLRYFNGEKLAELVEELKAEAYECGYEDGRNEGACGCC